MIKLNPNPQAVATLLGFLDGTPEQVAFLQGVVQTHGANPADYYVNNPPLDLSYEQMTQLPAFQQQDWTRFAHPYVIAQLLVDVCEKSNQPLPDNLHVAYEGAWQPLSYVQPTYVRAAPGAALPPAAPVPAPAPAPAAADPYPEPQAVSTPPAPLTLQLQPEADILDADILDAEFGEPMISRDVLGATVTMTAQAAQAVQAAQGAAQAPAPVPTHTDVAMPAQTDAAAAPAPLLAGAGEFGLPMPFMAASKGTSVFDKDPGGEPPKGASPRQIRDVMAMMPHFFAAPAGDVVGKGAGSVQRHRLYTAAALLLHTALSSVPDKSCPVGYLLWHLEHLRYNASQSPGGSTMLTYEQWLYRDGGE